jgi:hypothetical protein
VFVGDACQIHLPKERYQVSLYDSDVCGVDFLACACCDVSPHFSHAALCHFIESFYKWGKAQTLSVSCFVISIAGYLPRVIYVSAPCAKAYPLACVDAKPCLPIIAASNFEQDNFAVA